MGSELELIPNDELPDHIAIDYENVGKCLHTWHLVNYNMSAVSQLARDVILLALACPKLGRVMVDPNNAAELNDSIANVLQRDVYDKYAEQLTQLHSIAY
ncbi:hypothetical protein GGF41_000031 [Coemansia sp. RSA 2531]|nr:hypothetical protein GGF41_000031 [Coemansia sp. RSA 2531]